MSMNDRIKTGDIVPINIFVVKVDGTPLTGLTDLYVKVRRDSDGQYLDWDDLTFKAAGWVEQDKLLSEVDATDAKGLYGVSGGLATGSITNAVDDDTYQVIPLQTPGTDAQLPGPGELKIGQWVDVIQDTNDAVG